ncbi:hypothetical protein H9L01_06800 [Erysipelothrix inopinata]|uniref:Uncharacterized protein n=1 Tax=Erysipelothrix inopinata TaxID=225084 RepID=A0A7G9RWV3_9FIRM|nr:hypothetical protein [Erysipelothrix inopinata]QNN60078.1 hypothetical protein H9L01_06800 [Erysipelothrix inopinata]
MAKNNKGTIIKFTAMTAVAAGLYLSAYKQQNIFKIILANKKQKTY